MWLAKIYFQPQELPYSVPATKALKVRVSESLISNISALVGKGIQRGKGEGEGIQTFPIPVCFNISIGFRLFVLLQLQNITQCYAIFRISPTSPTSIFLLLLFSLIPIPLSRFLDLFVIRIKSFLLIKLLHCLFSQCKYGELDFK